jgi:hypothetical protein
MRRKTWIIVLSVIALALMAKAAMFFFEAKPDIAIPAELFGKWTTEDRSYAGRYFELSPTNVTFGRGENGVAVYSVESIHAAKEDDRIVYVVTFNDETGAEFRQSVYFQDNDNDALLFKNQKAIVWHKQAE